MKLLLLFKDLNQQYNLGFNIILFEQEEKSIYKTPNLDEVIDTVGQKIFRQFKVIDYREINGETYYLLTSSKDIIGWVNLKESITIYNKSTEPIKVINSKFDIDEINTILMLELENFDITKTYMSKGFVMLNGNILEAIYSKNKLMGFFNSYDLDHSMKINDQVNVESVKKFYLDSGFSIQAEDINNQKYMNMIDYFPILQIARLKYKGNILWAKFESFNHNRLDRKREDLKEISYTNLLAIHLANSYESERKNSKKIIKELVVENKKLIETVKKNEKYKNNTKELYSSKNNYTYQQLYNRLKNSKLGKIQIAYWKFLNRKRRNKLI